MSSADLFHRLTKRNFRNCVDLIDTYSFYPLSSSRFSSYLNSDRDICQTRVDVFLDSVDFQRGLNVEGTIRLYP